MELAAEDFCIQPLWRSHLQWLSTRCNGPFKNGMSHCPKRVFFYLCYIILSYFLCNGVARCGNRTFLRKNELHRRWSSESCHPFKGGPGPSSLHFQVLAFPASSVFSMFWVQLQCSATYCQNRESLWSLAYSGDRLCPSVRGLLQRKPAGPEVQWCTQ